MTNATTTTAHDNRRSAAVTIAKFARIWRGRTTKDKADAYQRYLVHGFREAWPFAGSPLRLRFTARGSKR